MTGRWTRGAAFALLAVAAIAGCGGGGSTGATPRVVRPTPTPSTAPTVGPSTCKVAPTPPPTPLPSPPPVPPNRGQIQHVVVIVQENRSFTNLFSGYHGADAPTCGFTHTGQYIALQPYPLEGPGNLGHMRVDFNTEYNNGAMNGFDKEYLIGQGLPKYFAYSFVPRSEITNYWTMAQEYTLGDHMFQSDSSNSFAAHQFLIAAQSGQPPNDDVVDSPNGVPWGCDAPQGSYTGIGLPGGGTAKGPFPCFDYDTLATRLNATHQTWKYYSPVIGDYGGNLWSAYDAISPIRYSGYWNSNVISPETRILTDIPAGALPAMTWVVPAQQNSDHPDSFSTSGPQWVGSIVNAIGTSKYWNSTAIFILWDDWGGWYDDAKPPQLDLVGLGFRVPFIVVSPYARHNYVSHVQYEYGSIVKFAEWAFSLQSLGVTDVRANALFDCFDFNQQPKPFQPLSLRRSADSFIAEPPDLRAPDED